MTTNLNDRYGIWFGPQGFLGHTDEKERTAKVVKALFSKLAPLLPEAKDSEQATYIDAGAGAGNLTQMVSKELSARYPNLQVVAVDNSPFMHSLLEQSLPQAKKVLIDLGQPINWGEIIGENKKAVVTTGSHVAYYPDLEQHLSNGEKKSFENFQNNLLKATEENGLVFLIHTPPAHPLESLRDAFSTTPEHETVIRQNLSFRGKEDVKHYDVQFTSEIFFPKLTDAELDIVFEGINGNGPDAYSANENPYKNLKNGDALLTARALLEFLIHGALEDIPQNGRTTYKNYLKEILLSKDNSQTVTKEGKEYQTIQVESVAQVISKSQSQARNMQIQQAVSQATQEMKNDPSIGIKEPHYQLPGVA